MLHDVGSQQMVDFPTGNDNTLDIFCTNRPFLVQRCLTVPGLSDHNFALVHTNILPARRKPTQRLVYFWKSANLEGMKEDICDFGHSFLQKTVLPHQLSIYGLASNKDGSRPLANTSHQR